MFLKKDTLLILQAKSYGVRVSTEGFKPFSQSSSLCRTALFLIILFFIQIFSALCYLIIIDHGN